MIENLLSHLADMQTVWDGVPVTYRATGCL